MNPFTRYMKDNNEPQPSQGSAQSAQSQAAASSRPAASHSPSAASQPARSSAPSKSSSSSSSRSATPAAKPSAGGRNILSSDVEIKGKVTFTNDLVVDGKIEGEVVSDGSLTIGENARIKAEIKTRSVVIYGKVYGNITVTDRVELKKEAELVGDIKAATISIEAGAIFVGKSTVGTPSQQPAATPAKQENKPAPAKGAKSDPKKGGLAAAS